MRLKPTAHRCSCSRNPPIPANGAQIGYRRIGNGRPLLVLNSFAATSADWDPSFIDRLASSNELILLDNRGIGSSTDNGKPQTHPALHRPGRDRRRTCLTRHLRATDRHVWHASPASSPTALPAVSQRSRRVHLPRIRRRCGRRACEALSQPGGSADCGDGRMAPRWRLRSAP